MWPGRMYYSRYIKNAGRIKMNFREKEQFRRKVLDTLKMSGTNHCGCFRINKHNSVEHENKKYEVYYELRTLGHELITEAEFKTGGRCDILDLTDGTIIEILHSETEKELKEKIKKYPSFLPVTTIKV